VRDDNTRTDVFDRLALELHRAVTEDRLVDARVLSLD
jgi:hypothetical protein